MIGYVAMKMVRKGTVNGIEANLENKQDGILGMLIVFKDVESAQKIYGNDVQLQTIKIGENKNGS